MQRDQQPDDVSWQWDDDQWSTSPYPPAHPDAVPEPTDERSGFSAAVQRLLRWASRSS